jgi:hypothetical protein
MFESSLIRVWEIMIDRLDGAKATNVVVFLRVVQAGRMVHAAEKAFSVRLVAHVIQLMKVHSDAEVESCSVL